MKDPLRRDEINELINANSVIKDAYKEFRKEYPYKPIIDMYSMSHFTEPVDEAVIKYVVNNKVYEYRYYKEL